MEEPSFIHEGVVKPTYRRRSRSHNLPGIPPTYRTAKTVQSEKERECRFPPIAGQDQALQRRRKPSETRVKDVEDISSFSDKSNESEGNEKFSDRRPDGFLDDRRKKIQLKIGQELERSDAALASTSKQKAHRTNSSLPFPATENVIIEEIYLLPKSKSADSLRSERQGICGHPALRETRSEDTNELRRIRHCGELLSRRIYSSRSPSPITFHGEVVTVKALNEEREKEKENSVCYATGRTKEKQAQRIRRHGICEVKDEATNKEEETSVGYSTDESDEKEGQYERPQGICEALDETTDKEKENPSRACLTTDESEEKQGQKMGPRGICEAKGEAAEKEKENPSRACLTTDESEEKQEQQMGPHGICEAKDEAADKEEKISRSYTTDESEERRGQQMRRQGVCEAVDNTAARRRRARVLKKKLFGDDLPIHDDLMIQRALNKRM